MAWIFLVSFDSQNKAIITFTIDDGITVQLEKGMNVFEAKEIEGSVAIITNTLSTSNRKYIELSQLKELQSKGWEILSHSVSHPYFNKINNSQTKSEIISSKSDLNRKQISVTGFVTPYSECNDQCKAYLNKNYEYAFTKYKNTKNIKELIITKDTDPYRLYRVGIDKRELNEVLLYIDYIAKNGGWVSFYLHGIDGNDYISSEELEKLIDYCRLKNVDITTPKKAFDKIFSD